MDFFATLRSGVDTSTSWGIQEHTGWQDEQLSWKTTGYIGDWSWLDEFHVEGPDALRFLSDYAVNSFASFETGQAKHAVFCNAAGKVIGEGVLLRLGEQEFEFQSRGPVVLWLEHVLAKGRYDAMSRTAISKFKLQVSGPNALAILEKAMGRDLRGIGFMRFQELKLAGVETRFLRQGMAGEIGFELQGPGDRASEVRAAVIEAGQEFGLRQLGSRTAMINHLEAAFPTITHDYLPAVGDDAEHEFFERYRDIVPIHGSADWFRSFTRTVKAKGSFEGSALSDWYRSPIELNWGKSVQFDHDFHGRSALEAEKANPQRKLVSLEWDKDDVVAIYASLFEQGEAFDFMEMPRHSWNVMYANRVVDGDRDVGVATSRGYSFYYRKMLSHCVIDMDYAAPGTEVAVIWGEPGSPQKRIRAIVGPSPYKPDNRRADLKAI